jgi:excisionase family DNA binding protein
VTVKKAALELGVAPSTIYRAIQLRELTHLRIRGRIVIEPEHLEAYRKACTVKAVALEPQRTYKWV